MTKLVFISSAGGGLGAGPGVTAATGQWSRPGGPHGDISLSWAHCIVNLHPDVIKWRARNLVTNIRAQLPLMSAAAAPPHNSW